MIRATNTFLQALGKLNDAQRQAVDLLHGPVLVIAGPGTGKTDVLTLRIGNILLQPDVAPSNILCLTYTEAAASEMRDRLLSYIGTEANNVRIQTFHGFCNSVIQEHAERFSMRGDLNPASALDRVDVVLRVMEELPGENLLVRNIGDTTFDRLPMLNLYELMKKEGWTVEFINEEIDRWLEDAKSHEDFIYRSNRGGHKPGELKEKVYKDEVARMERLRAAANTFGQYCAYLEEAGRYDFEDMLIRVHEAFARDHDFLLDYQEQFQYILVDEFQDTSGIQLALLLQLTDYSEPNVFVVGDDDQAIFRFQGALVRNIMEYYDKRRPAVITLVQNYRSSGHIVHAAAAVIQHNRHTGELDGLDFSKEIVASGRFAGHPSLPRIVAFQSRDQEEAWIAHELTTLFRNGTLTDQSVAVLYRKHENIKNIVRVLQAHEIPYSIVREQNLLDEPLINNILHILGYVHRQYLKLYDADDLLFTIMHFRHFDIPPRDIARIAAACMKTKENDYRIALRDLLRDNKKLRPRQYERIDRIRAFYQAIETLCGEINDYTLPVFVERMLMKCGIVQWVLSHPDRPWYLKLISSLYEHIGRESKLRAGLTLAQYLSLIDRHRENKIPIPVKQVYDPGKGITLSTVHGAKGQEFDRVYLMDCTENGWEKYTGQRSMHYKLPGSLVAQSREAPVEDDRRLFYVAMTRAHQELICTFARKDGENKLLKVSRFISEMTEGENTPEIEEIITPEEIVDSYYADVINRPVVFGPMIDPAVVDKVLGTYRLSASDLSLFLGCPRTFYFEKILKIPTAPKAALTFGNVVHSSFDRLFREYWDTLFLNGDTLIRLFEDEMLKRKALFTAKEYENHIIQGRESLRMYINEYEVTWRDPDEVITEYRAEAVHRDVPLKGFIDKLEVRPSTVHLVDYKTGKYQATKLKTPDSDKNPYGGSHWQQMVFYKILIDEDPAQQWNAVKGIVDYVDIKRNKKSRRHEIVFDGENIQFVSDLIVDVYARIKARDFDHKCDRWQCKWCSLIESEFGRETALSLNEEVGIEDES